MRPAGSKGARLLLREIHDRPGPARHDAEDGRRRGSLRKWRALDAIREVGPGSHYLGCGHTQANFQSAFYRSPLADNNSFEQWEIEGQKRIEQRANALCRSWLDHYEAPPLDPAIDEALLAYIQKRKDSMPDAFT